MTFPQSTELLPAQVPLDPPTVAPAAAIPAVTVLGVPFHQLDMQGTLDVIERFIREGRSRQICLANAYTLSVARQDPELADVLRGADLVLADGMSIVWGARWIGVHLPQRVAGPDLMAALCERAAAKRYGIYLFGNSPETLERLRLTLLERSPELRIVGMHSPPMCKRLSAEETAIILGKLRETKPDILFVSMSMPKQEKWIRENLGQLPVPTCLGVGAAFNFLSGDVRRAPQGLQNVGLEWLYRLYQEPRRLWKRYLLGNAVFLSLLATHLVRQKLMRSRTAPAA